MQTDYINLIKAADMVKDIDIDMDDLLLLAVEGKILLYHKPPHYIEVPYPICRMFLDHKEGGTTGLLLSNGAIRQKREIGEFVKGPYGEEEVVKCRWKPQKTFLKRVDMLKIKKSPEPASIDRNLNIIDILNQITPEHYPEELKQQQKSGITQSINALKKQLPAAFEFCFKITISSMPLPEGERNDWLTYSQSDIEEKAGEDGIKTEMARQIYASLPTIMKR